MTTKHTKTTKDGKWPDFVSSVDFVVSVYLLLSQWSPQRSRSPPSTEHDLTSCPPWPLWLLFICCDFDDYRKNRKVRQDRYSP